MDKLEVDFYHSVYREYINQEDDIFTINIGSVEGIEEYVSYGRNAIVKSDFDEGIYFFESARELTPFNALPYYLLGMTYTYKNQPLKAIVNFKKVIEYEPECIGAHINIGGQYAKINQYKQAENHLEKALLLDPKALGAYFNLGTIFLRLKRYDKSKKCFDYVLKVMPSSQYLGIAYNSLGLIAYVERSFAVAISFFEKGLILDKEDYVSFNICGASHYNLNNYKQAVSFWKKAIELEPNYANSQNNLGLYFLRVEKQYKEACFYLLNSISIYSKRKMKDILNNDDTYANTCSLLAETYMNIGEYQGASDWYEFAVKLATPKKKSKIICDWGIDAFKHENYKLAIELFKEALNREISKADGWICHSMLGKAYLILSSFDLAVLSLQKAIKIRPDFLTNTSLGDAFAKKGAHERAICFYNEALKYDGDHEAVYEQMVMSYLELENYSEAAACCNKRIELSPSNFQGYYQLGYLYYFYMKDLVKAEKCFSKVLELNPSHEKTSKLLSQIGKG